MRGSTERSATEAAVEIDGDTIAALMCDLCGKPLRPGDAYYSITGNHYNCQFPRGRGDPAADDGSKMDAMASRLDEALRALGSQNSAPMKPRKRRAPEGAGPIALKTRALAVKAIEAELGAVLTDVSLWNQQGAYRGDSWQLDRWGMSFAFVRDGHLHRGSASSLARMTDCVKAKAIAATPGDLAFNFQLDPAPLSQHHDARTRRPE